MHSRIFSSILSFYPLDASTTSQALKKSAPVENHSTLNSLGICILCLPFSLWQHMESQTWCANVENLPVCTLYWVPLDFCRPIACSNWHPHWEPLSVLGGCPKPTYISLILCASLSNLLDAVDIQDQRLKSNWLPKNDLLESSGNVSHNWINYFD